MKERASAPKEGCENQKETADSLEGCGFIYGLSDIPALPGWADVWLSALRASMNQYDLHSVFGGGLPAETGSRAGRYTKARAGRVRICGGGDSELQRHWW